MDKELAPSPPLLGEARVALFAVREALFLSKDDLLFEGDNATVTRAICSVGSDTAWSISPVLFDIHFLMGDYPNWRFQFVKRQANSVAHNVAQWAAHATVIGNVPTSSILSRASDNSWFPLGCPVIKLFV